jgi:hypothetical protein
VHTIKSFAFTNGRARRMPAATVSGVSTRCVAEANVHGRHAANAVKRGSSMVKRSRTNFALVTRLE